MLSECLVQVGRLVIDDRIGTSLLENVQFLLGTCGRDDLQVGGLETSVLDEESVR